MPRLFLIGVGLMGASFALAARRAGVFDRVVAYDVDDSAVAGAIAAGIVDAAEASVGSGSRGADAVLIAVPPSKIAACIAAVCDAGGASGAPVFDVGSVKAPVLAALCAQFGALPPRFVPCHPMAGAVGQGFTAADADLYRGRRVFLTPTPDTDAVALARVEGYWRACGADTRCVDANEHDRAVAATSHLPHLLAFAYMARFGGGPPELFDFAGPGFRDFTRIAAADPGLWRDIVLSNRDAVGTELAQLVQRLETLRQDLAAARGTHLEAVFAAGRDARAAYLAHTPGDGHDAN